MHNDSSIIRLLFICLGNICRSPLAQGIFEEEIKQRGLSHLFFVDSAGTSGWHKDEKPHHSSIQIARQYKIHIDKQRSRPVSLSDRKAFDYFIPMDENNQYDLLNEFAFPADRIIKIRRFDPIDKDSDVPDPYGQELSYFDSVYQILASCTYPLIKFLLKQKM